MRLDANRGYPSVMAALASRRVSSLLLVTSLSLRLTACGGTSVRQHDDPRAASGSGGMAQGAGGTTGGEAAMAGGSSGMTGGSASTAGGSSGVTGSAAATAGGSGAVSGAGTSGANGGTTTCVDIAHEVTTELDEIQRCMTASECGQVLMGTSCGCTRDLVARLDADTTRFTELRETTINGEACTSFPSTCDCPAAHGFTCLNGVCTWNYVTVLPPDPCTPAKIGQMCVVGDPTQEGDSLDVGMQLKLAFRPFGCFSGSCTDVIRGSCEVQPDGDDFVVSAVDLCLGGPPDPNMSCTADCSESLFAHCLSETTLTAGTHTVRYADDPELSVTFTVPSAVGGTQCVGELF